MNYYLKKQRNFCVNLLKKEKKRYNNNLDITIFTDNKKFWQRIRPLFSEKQKGLQKEFILIEKEKIISGNLEVAAKMNNYFIEANENLEIKPFLDTNEYRLDRNESIDDIVEKYKKHPSVLRIKEYFTIDVQFSFKLMKSNKGFENYIGQLDPKKASVDNDIPAKLLVETKDIVANHIKRISDDSIIDMIFPISLKLGDVMPIHKKDERTVKENYRPVSLLPTISKLLERDMYGQIIECINKFLSPYLFGFRKGRSTEQCLNIMLEKWKKALGQKLE